MQVFDFKDYKKFVKTRIQSLPKRGRGEFRKLAKHLRVNSTLISQIFNGDRELNPDQALLVCQYFGLNDMESRYFIQLVHKVRAGTTKYKKYLQLELDKILKEARTVKAQIPEFEEITEEARAMYYSDWIYAAVRLLTSLPGLDNIDAIASHLKMPRERLRPILDFLLNHGLCLESNGKLSYGTKLTHLKDDSPLINSHRRNWRSKAIEKINNPHPDDFFYSLAITLSEEDHILIKKKMINLISETIKIAEPSEPKKIFCLNLDWFEVK